MLKLPARLVACLICLAIFSASAHAAVAPRKIVLIAGPKSHGPEGNRIHDYPWSVKLLKAMLLKSNVSNQVRVEVVRDGWPQDESILADADAVVVISDGRDGDLYEEAPHVASPERVAEVQKLIDRGCGLLTIHFSTFGPDRFADRLLDWTGGYFDWEEEGQRKWYSAIETQETEVVPVNGTHAVLSGVKPFQMKEEFYYNLRFALPAEEAQAASGGVTPFSVLNGTTTPLLVVPTLKGRDALGQCVAWARERSSGGRGFGTTCGHFYDNWQNDNFRKLVLNAILWAAHGEIPAGGVDAPFLNRVEICEVLGEPFDAELANEPAAVVVRADVPEADRIRVLMFAGNEAHKWHNWEKTSPAIKELLEIDPRISVDVSHNPEDLATVLPPDGTGDRRYDVIVQNYVNWLDATPLSEPSRQAFVDFLNGGGGLVLVHFANGAWHFSLPEAGGSDWPEYRKIARRVWNHAGPDAERSSHDPYRPFTVVPTKVASPIIDGLKRFSVVDELYFSQHGAEPVEPLITAKSVITRQQEPLAWTYTYGNGRVFQTLLGHSEKTYEVFEPREMLRRAVAWCAQKDVRPLQPEQDTALRRSASSQPLVPGWTATALNAGATGVFVKADNALRRAPITVDAWVKLDSASNFNIVVASEEKSSPEHWELYSYAGTGVLSVYLPGHGGEYRSETSITDREWHAVRMILEPARLRLYVDSKPVLDRSIDPPFQTSEGAGGPTLLAIGRLVEEGLGCDGLIDEVRFRRGAIEQADNLDQPWAVDDQTLALWRFDALKEGGVLADEQGKYPASFDRPAIEVSAAPAPKKELNHWGKELVGFDWKEGDSVDGRWQQTQVGTFLASVIPIEGGMVEKGLSIKVGEAASGTVLYDTGRGQMRAAWLDGFLKFHPARYGLIEAPSPAGRPVFVSTPHAGFAPENEKDIAQFHYRGLWRNGSRTVLEWTVNGVPVRETPWLEEVDGHRIVTRSLEVGTGDRPVVLSLFQRPGDWTQAANDDMQIVVTRDGDEAVAFGLNASSKVAQLRVTESGLVELVFPGRTQPVKATLSVWRAPAANQELFANVIRKAPERLAVEAVAVAGPAQWTESIVTQGVRAKEDAPYVVDTVTIPFENPYKALFFTAGHDFLTSDAAMICTVHGDVWLVTGLAGDWSRLEWKRFATGLFQPLGMVIRKRLTPVPPAAENAVASLTSGFDILVLGRDHISRLHDLNGDNEADYYEVFHENIDTSAGGHDYVACLESDSAGRLYYLNAKEGLVRVSPDGQHKEVVATGFRNPNGLGVGPNAEMTVAPQEGEWTPASGIFLTRDGGYGGYGGPRVKPGRPLGYDPPLCWIPRRQDNSSGGQVWVTSDRWGPLQGKMLHLSYGQCTLQLVLSEFIHGQAQGGTLVFPPVFESGVCRGRFSPFDGQLYLTGLRGWTTAATQDGCFQRVRYTGQTVHVPVGVATLANGLMLTFSQPLSRDSAEDPDNYSAQQWNITYRKEYGSPDFKVSNPKEEGRDPVEILSATLLDDQRTVFLEVEHMQPVSQFVLSYTLAAADGTKLAQTYAHTIHNVREAPFDPAKITRRPRKGQLTSAEQETLRPGVKWTFTRGGESQIVDVQLSRLATLAEVQPGFGEASPFQVTGEGFLFVPLKGEYRFRLEGDHPSELLIHGRSVLPASAQGSKTVAIVALNKGYNRFQIQSDSREGAPVSVRLLWSSEAFAEEPVPPDALSTSIDAPEEVRLLEAHTGSDLIVSYNCAKCHQGLEHLVAGHVQRGAPRLDGIGTRLQRDWLAAWIQDPRALRGDATMPAVFSHLEESERLQAAADLAAWLVSQMDGAAPAVEAFGDEQLGEELYEDLGCIVCHRFTSEEEVDDWHRLSLAAVGAKFAPGALVEFLKSPTRHFPGIYMPDFRLSDAEAGALTAYLQRRGSAGLPSMTKEFEGDAERGRALFKSSGCGQCHSVTPGEPLSPPSVRPLVPEGLQRGCLAESTSDAAGSPGAAVRPAPRWSLSADERSAIRGALTNPELKTGVGAAAESSRLMRSMHCSACHDRDTRRSPRMEMIATESNRGFAPEQLPSLTFTGDRLKASWIEEFISGKIEEKPRQWLKGRMPAFPAYSSALAKGLAAEHGHAASEVTAGPHADSQLIDAGRELIQSSGLDCRQCHGIGEIPPTGDRQTLLAPGINFAMVKDRMRGDFYQRWMLDPPRFDLNTRMPKLSADGRTTKVKQILEGDAVRQFDAIWAFLQEPRLEAASQ